MTGRIPLLLAVCAMHGIAFVILASGMDRIPPKPAAIGVLVVTFIQPKIRDDDGSPAGPDLSRLAALMEIPFQDTNMYQPEINFSVARNGAAAMAAPTRLISGRAAMEPYIKQAALLPGEGATVVLRVEVLATGQPGRIEIDASSGSAQVDQAAVGYARTQHWYAGRINGTPRPMWLRWGVHLQA